MVSRSEDINDILKKCDFYKNKIRFPYNDELGLLRIDSSDPDDICKEISKEMALKHPIRRTATSNLFYQRTMQPNNLVEGIGFNRHPKKKNNIRIVLFLIFAIIIISLIKYI